MRPLSLSAIILVGATIAMTQAAVAAPDAATVTTARRHSAPVGGFPFAGPRDASLIPMPPLCGHEQRAVYWEAVSNRDVMA